MPANPTLRIEQSDGTERATLTGFRGTRTRSLIEQWRGTITVDRPDWLNVAGDVDTVTDRFIIKRGDGTTLHAGRFGNDERDGDDVTITVRSYEQDAKDAEPTGGRVVYQNVADDTVVSDAINAVGTLSAGTLETGDSSVSFTFAHAQQSKVIRDAAQPAGMDVAYRNDRTVDFLTRLGSDKSNITISSTSQDIVDSLSVEDNSLDPVTHIRGLGAQQGPDQVQAEAVIDSYQTGDRQVWRRFKNKDIVQQDRLQDIVNRLADEFDTERRRILVETALVGVDVGIGDSVTVDLPEHDINRTLRIVRETEVIGPTDKTVVTLTNRSPERGGERKRRDDLGRFNAGDQGFVDRDTDAFGWQPVTSTDNAIRPYPYPDDVETEIKAEVVITSRPYRAYSSGAAAGGEHTHDVDVTHPSHDHDVDILTTSGDNTEYPVQEQSSDFVSGQLIGTGDGWVQLSEFIPDSFTDISWTNAWLGGGINTVDTEEDILKIRVEDFDAGEFFPDDDGTRVRLEGDDTPHPFNTQIPIPGNRKGNELRAQVNLDKVQGTGDIIVNSEVDWATVGVHQHQVDDLETSTTALGTTSTETSTANGEHTHPVDPGLIEFGTETASNVDLIVNGTTIATDINSGEFTETVDISGQLTAGANTIELSSDSLGLVNLLVQTQLFRRGRTSS